MAYRSRFDFTDRRELLLTRGLQLVLLGLAAFGVLTGDVGVAFTTLGGVAVALGGTGYFRTLARKLSIRRRTS